MQELDALAHVVFLQTVKDQRPVESRSLQLAEVEIVVEQALAGRKLAGLAVDWHDTPGLDDSGDAIEAKAVNLARALLDRADFVIAITRAYST